MRHHAAAPCTESAHSNDGAKVNKLTVIYPPLTLFNIYTFAARGNLRTFAGDYADGMNESYTNAHKKRNH